MKISELIEELEFLQDKVGDVNVTICFTNEFGKPNDCKDVTGCEVIENIELVTLDSNNDIVLHAEHEYGYIEGRPCNYEEFI